MSEREPIDPVLESHLAKEREAPPRLSPEAKRRMLAGVLGRVTAASAEPASPRKGSTSPSVSRAAWFAGGASVGLALGVAIGVAIGMTLSTTSSPPPDPGTAPSPVVLVPTDASSDTPSVPLDGAVDAPDASVLAAAPPRERPDARPGRASEDVTPSDREGADEPSVPATTADERALVDRARVALRRGDAHGALVALMEHERRFPEGVLAEDRDRLAVESLVQEGRIDAARSRIARYLREHPSGAHRRALEDLDASLAASPSTE
jgi:hypothetical protein